MLFEEKKQIILDFAKIKLKNNKKPEEESIEYKVFQAIVERCDTNVDS